MDADLQDYPMASSKKGTPEGNTIFFAKPVESLSRKSSDRGSTPLGSTTKNRFVKRFFLIRKYFGALSGALLVHLIKKDRELFSAFFRCAGIRTVQYCTHCIVYNICQLLRIILQLTAVELEGIKVFTMSGHDF